MIARKKGLRIIAVGIAAAAVGAGILSLGEYVAFARALAVRDASADRLAEARRIVDRHPQAFGSARSGSGEVSLKAIVQEAAGKHGVPIASLSEIEREAGKGRRERQVVTRLVRAEHPKLVAFLGDLEEKGGGAKVKELHLRPSKDQTGFYEEVEVILSRIFSSPGGRP
jgi:hypothetical protein